jgi:polyhydroxybutyrate depolymerase
MARTRWLAASALAALIGGTAPAAGSPRIEGPAPPRRQGRDVNRVLGAGGLQRDYTLHVPPGYDGRRPTPLLVVLHGGGGNGQSMARMTGFSALADRKGFLVVYPDGTGLFRGRLLTWNTCDCCGWALDHHVDDVSFIRRLLDTLERDWRIDVRRVFATGISNGGMMAYRLGCELSDRFAAIAPVAGAMDCPSCSPSEPVSVIVFHGTGDERVPYEGGIPKRQADRHRRVDQPVSHAVSFWVRHDGCSATADRKEEGHIVRETYSFCRSGAAVELVTILGGGHAWPGGQKWAAWAPEPTHETSATEAMWEFFAAHPKK